MGSTAWRACFHPYDSHPGGGDSGKIGPSVDLSVRDEAWGNAEVIRLNALKPGQSDADPNLRAFGSKNKVSQLKAPNSGNIMKTDIFSKV